MINSALLIGFGEVGQAHYKNLSKVYPYDIFYKDKGDAIYSHDGSDCSGLHKTFDLLLIATQCDPANMEPFYKMVMDYTEKYQPMYIDILTTTPCGTTENLEVLIPGVKITKSTIRGMHPYLDKFLRDIPKHIGGQSAEEMKEYYEKAGIPCICHAKSRATELFHVLNNFIYGVNILAADECSKYCREYGVDYMEFLSYRKSNNDGFLKAGYPSKMSPILTPLNNNGVLGHCISYAPTTIPDDKRGPLAKMLAEYNSTKGVGIKPGH